MILTFTKYKGMDLKDVAKKDPRFAIWFVQKFSDKYFYEMQKIGQEIINIANSELYWNRS